MWRSSSLFAPWKMCASLDISSLVWPDHIIGWYPFRPKANLRNFRNVAPTNGAKLQQFVCALQWMRSAIPSFSSLVKPLLEVLESVYACAGRRTQGAVGRILLPLFGWGSVHDDCFQACKTALTHQVTLCHYRDVHRLCVNTDASDFIWAGIVTTVPPADLAFPYVDQRHEPLCFLRGDFTGSQMGLSILEKEHFSILSTVERMHWLLGCSAGFDLFTYQENLIFLFDTSKVIPDLSQTFTRKVLR